MARPKGFHLSRKAWDDLIVGEKKLTVSEVSEVSGIQSPTISNLLSGRVGASLKMARTLCEALGIHVETLFPATDPGVVADVLARHGEAA